MNIFSNLGSEASFAIILWLIGAFIIGFVTAWIYKQRKMKDIEDENEALKTAAATSKIELENAQKTAESAKSTLATATTELEEKRKRIKEIEVEKGDLHTQIYNLKDRLKVAEEAKMAYADQLQELKAGGGLVLGDTNSDTSVAELQEQVYELEEDIEGYKVQVVTLNKAKEHFDIELKKANARVEVLRGKILGLEEELKGTAAALEDCKAGNVMGSSIEEEDDEDATEMSIGQAKAAIAAAIGTKIPVATVEDAEDLKVINGIGTFLERKLHEIGIFTYRQIANFDEEIIEQVTAAIEFFPGRIEKDEWVPQAKKLMSSDEEDAPLARGIEIEIEEEEDDAIIEVEGAPSITPEEAQTAREKVKNEILGIKIPAASADDKDDLKVISGVGPFIEGKLNDLGIFTYEQISLFDGDTTKTITKAIEFFPGRIERDEWVKQAKELFKQKKAKIAENSLGAIIGGKIAAASADQKDDLKLISGVGPFIEEKLNHLGIYTFEQVSQFDEQIIELITDAIMFFPGRIVRDGWVEQAKELKNK